MDLIQNAKKETEKQNLNFGEAHENGEQAEVKKESEIKEEGDRDMQIENAGNDVDQEVDDKDSTLDIDR